MSPFPHVLSLSLMRRFTVGACAIAFCSAAAFATPITFTAEDLNAPVGGPSAHPNSTAAAASFMSTAAAIGSLTTISFEGATLGSFSSLTLASGATMTGTDYTGQAQTVRNTSNSPGIETLDGSNTTAGGSYFVEVQGGTVTFNFATPVNSFGVYITGIQTAFFQDTITFSDGSSRTINVPGAGTNGSTGAVDFVGFTDFGQSVSSITLTASNPSIGADFVGIDDVTFGTPNAGPAGTPEPASLLLTLSGCVAGFGAGYRRFRARRS